MPRGPDLVCSHPVCTAIHASVSEKERGELSENLPYCITETRPSSALLYKHCPAYFLNFPFFKKMKLAD